MDHQDARDRIIALLQAVADQELSETEPPVKRFEEVIARDFYHPPALRFVSLHYAGESEEEETLGNAMTWHRWEICCWWRLTVVTSEAERFELEKAETLRALKTQIRGDYRLGGTVGGARLTPAEYGREFDENRDRWATMRFSYEVYDMEGEEISV